MNKLTHKSIRYIVIALLLAAFLGGLYLNALCHRYKSLSGIVIMDTWTKEVLMPDSMGNYKPAHPFVLDDLIAP